MRIMENMSILPKTMAAASVMVLAMLGIVAFALNTVRDLSDATQTINAVQIPRLTTIMTAGRDLNLAVISEKNVILETRPDRIEALIRAFDQQIGTTKADLERMRGLVAPERRPVVDKALAEITAYEDVARRVIALGRVNRNEEALEISLGEGRQVRLRAEALLENMIDHNKNQLEQIGA